jgi:hypothetical protein
MHNPFMHVRLKFPALSDPELVRACHVLAKRLIPKQKKDRAQKGAASHPEIGED